MSENTIDPVTWAARFHEIYERLAPSFGYETRDDTKAFDPTTPNGKLMTAVCGEIIATLSLTQPTAPAVGDEVEAVAKERAAIVAYIERIGAYGYSRLASDIACGEHLESHASKAEGE